LLSSTVQYNAVKVKLHKVPIKKLPCESYSLTFVMFPFCRQAVVQKRAIYYMETVNNLDNLCDNLYSLDNLDNLCEYFNNVTFSYEVRKELGDQPHHQATNHPDKVCWTAGHSTWRGLLASARRSRKEQEAAASPGSGAQEGILGGASSKRAQQ